MTLLDEAQQVGYARMAEVSAHSGRKWMEYAEEFLDDFLRTHPEMHVDQLWAAGLKAPATGDGRALGQVINNAANDKKMARLRAAGGVVARPSVNSHGQLKAVWRSRIYGVPA